MNARVCTRSCIKRSDCIKRQPHTPIGCNNSSRAALRIARATSMHTLRHSLRFTPLPALPSVSRVHQRVAVQTRASGSTTNGHLGDSTLEAMALQPRNVLGGPLECCCLAPRTGYYRDGFCKTDESDHGRHVICAKVTKEFLEFSKSKGNDLMTPAPWYNFPGLKPGDKWCLCALRWKEAFDAGVAPPVFLKCTHAKALEYVTMETLKKHAVEDKEDLK